MAALKSLDGDWLVFMELGHNARVLLPWEARQLAEKWRPLDSGANEATCDALESAAAHCERRGAGPA